VYKYIYVQTYTYIQIEIVYVHVYVMSVHTQGSVHMSEYISEKPKQQPKKLREKKPGSPGSEDGEYDVGSDDEDENTKEKKKHMKASNIDVEIRRQAHDKVFFLRTRDLPAMPWLHIFHPSLARLSHVAHCVLLTPRSKCLLPHCNPHHWTV